MDETQHFCLRWNNYQSSITSAFENLRDDEDFVDVTLACEGRSIKAHRVVLSACSPYFRDLLKSTPCKHPVILLQDVNFLDLHSLVEFIYHGEVNVHQKSLQSFLKTAEVLRVSGLTQQQAEETHSQLAQIQQNLANSGVRTPLNSLHSSMHDVDAVSPYARTHTASPQPPLQPTQQLPLASTHINSQLFKRSIAAAALFRRERNNSTPTSVGAGGVGVGCGTDDSNNAMKRLRVGSTDNNGLPTSNNNTPDLMHARSASPQLTPADFSTMKHNNNNTPPLKDEKRNGNGNNNNTGNGISSNDKLNSLTPSPLARSADDVKSEPMELVCANNNPAGPDEHSNDSTGENEGRRSSSGDGGKGSMSSGNDEEIENSLPPHPPPPFLISPAESKLFPPAPFNFSMSNIDPAALAGFNSQLQSAAELAVSPQGGSTNLLGGVIVPGGNSNSNSNNNNNQQQQTHHLHSTSNSNSSTPHHHQHHQHQQQQHHHSQQQQQLQLQHQLHKLERGLGGDRDSVDTTRSASERERDRLQQQLAAVAASEQQARSAPNTPPNHGLHVQQQSPLHHQSQSSPSPSTSSSHHHFGHQATLPLSMLSTHHLHAHHELSPGPHHHHHLTRAGSPLSHHHHHHHLLHHRRSSLSPSPTGRASAANSAAGILSSTRAAEMAGANRLLLPLPLNACHRCDVCGKLLSTKLTLKRHKEQQHLQPLNNAVCNLCHKVFRTLNSLNNHKSIYHRRQKNHHSYFHHGGGGVGAGASPGSRLHQSLSSLSAAAAANSNVGGPGNGNAVAAAAAAAAAAAELLLSPIVGAAAAGGAGGPTVQLSAHQQAASQNIVKPCMDYL